MRRPVDWDRKYRCCYGMIEVMSLFVVKPQKIKPFHWLVICVLVYLLAVAAYTLWSNHAFKAAALHEIDQKLQLAAKSLKFMLASDFHDRAVDENAISMDEELKNRRAISGFAFDSDLKWLYTLVKKDGKFYFSAPTVTEEEARRRASWYFLAYDDIPESFVRAFDTRTTVFGEYKDQWGYFRSIAVAETSPGGNPYLACADYEISYLERILFKNQIRSMVTALYFLAFSLPFLLCFRSSYSAYSAHLESINAELTAHKAHLEEAVEARTAALKQTNASLHSEIKERAAAEKEKEKLIKELQTALSEVKTLSGLLPICASCKKIRDDKGYWKQIEAYISEHSKAEFSHGICPECAEKLYPDFGSRRHSKPQN